MTFFKSFCEAKRFSEAEVLAWLEWDVAGTTHLESFTEQSEMDEQFAVLADAGVVASVVLAGASA